MDIWDFTRLGYLGEVKSCIESGADVNERDSNGCTLLQYASFYGHVKLIKLFLEQGLEINATENKGRTALIIASEIALSDTVKLLLEHGANPNIVNDRGQSALISVFQHADNGLVFKRIPETIRLLLEHGANIDFVEKQFNWTPLTCAVVANHYEAVKLLLEKGADVNQKDNRGWSALMYAIEENRHRMVLEFEKQSDRLDEAGKFLIEKNRNKAKYRKKMKIS